jgi:uncharacterized membrane protein YagU involved in acid resistance
VSEERLNIGSRLLIGGIAGFVGTLAMTAAMSRLHRMLPAKERYPLTPREIVDALAHQDEAEPALSETAALDTTTAAHFAYGAATGALLGAANPKVGPAEGALAGVAVWAASYLGWIPGVGILKPATDHPRRRNALMIGAHLVWGATTAIAMRELVLARRTMMAPGPDKDVPERRWSD